MNSSRLRVSAVGEEQAALATGALLQQLRLSGPGGTQGGGGCSVGETEEHWGAVGSSCLGEAAKAGQDRGGQDRQPGKEARPQGEKGGRKKV